MRAPQLPSKIPHRGTLPRPVPQIEPGSAAGRRHLLLAPATTCRRRATMRRPVPAATCCPTPRAPRRCPGRRRLLPCAPHRCPGARAPRPTPLFRSPAPAALRPTPLPVLASAAEPPRAALCTRLPALASAPDPPRRLEIARNLVGLVLKFRVADANCCEMSS
jgi:hypothetical protein